MCAYACEDARVSACTSVCGSIYAYARARIRTIYSVYCVYIFNASSFIILKHIYLILTYGEHYFDQCPVISTYNSIFLSASHLTDFTTNLAIGKQTAMSYWQMWHSSLGANGVRNGTLEKGCTFAPYEKTYPTYNWWKVDLEYVYDVKLVMFLNRGDCCGELYIPDYCVLIHYYTLQIINVRVLVLLVGHVGNTLRFKL